jgi:hypothetical protein
VSESKPKSRQLHRTISFRLDEEAYARFQNEAYKAGVSQGQLIRAFLDGEKRADTIGLIDKETSLRILASLVSAERKLEELSNILTIACQDGTLSNGAMDNYLSMLAAINQSLREAVHYAH